MGVAYLRQKTLKNFFNERKNIFPKMLEVYFTFMIELIWGKKRILEMYMNVIETGNGVFGIESAAKKYYNKPAKLLTRNEAAMIAASLRNPKQFTVKPLSGKMVSRSAWIAQQMNNL